MRRPCIAFREAHRTAEKLKAPRAELLPFSGGKDEGLACVYFEGACAGRGGMYCIIDSTIPLYRYVATVRLKRVTDRDRTFWHWELTFATPLGRERELTEQVGRNVYEAGFEALRKYLA